jgi:hypothetical protein
MTFETSGTTRQTAHHHILQRLNIQPDNSVKLRKNNSAKSEMFVLLAVT